MNFVVVGAGAWGTAFALHLSRAGHAVTLVPRRAEHAAALTANRENTDYLPGFKLPEALIITTDLKKGLANADEMLLACPVQVLRETAGRVRDALIPGAPLRLIISLAKGLELGTHLRPAEIIAAVVPGFPVGALTGPTNASEVARGLPAAMVLAATDARAYLTEVQAALSGATLRVYTSDDLAGDFT